MRIQGSWIVQMFDRNVICKERLIVVCEVSLLPVYLCIELQWI